MLKQHPGTEACLDSQKMRSWALQVSEWGGGEVQLGRSEVVCQISVGQTVEKKERVREKSESIVI